MIASDRNHRQLWLPKPVRQHGLSEVHGTDELFLDDAYKRLEMLPVIAMLISALIERTIRQAMTDAGLSKLSLYPEDRGCATPTTARILEIFIGVARHELTAPNGQVLRTLYPELTDLQQQVLSLLDIPTSDHSPITQMLMKAVREVRRSGCS